MLLAKGYLSLQDRLKLCQSVLNEEAKENQRREAVILQQETNLGPFKARQAQEVGSNDCGQFAQTCKLYSSNPPQAIAWRRIRARGLTLPVRWGR